MRARSREADELTMHLQRSHVTHARQLKVIRTEVRELARNYLPAVRAAAFTGKVMDIVARVLITGE